MSPYKIQHSTSPIYKNHPPIPGGRILRAAGLIDHLDKYTGYELYVLHCLREGLSVQMLQDDLDVDDTAVDLDFDVAAADGYPLGDAGTVNNSSSSPEDSPTNHRAFKRQITTWRGFESTNNTLNIMNMETSETSKSGGSSMNMDNNTSTQGVDMATYIDSIHGGCQAMASSQPQAPYTPNQPQHTSLSATPIPGLGSFLEGPGVDLFVPQNNPNTWNPGSYSLGTMQVPGTCRSECALPHNFGLETPTPVLNSNTSLTSMSYNTPQTMPETSNMSSSNTATTSHPRTLFSHAPSQTLSSTSSRLAYSQVPEATASLPVVDTRQTPTEAQALSEEQDLIDYWVPTDGQPMRLDVALSTNRTPHSDSNLAPEWKELRERYFNNSRTSPAIVVHCWGLFDKYLSMVAFLEYIHANLLLDDPFPADDNELDRLLVQAQNLQVIDSGLSVGVIRAWVERGWYARMRDGNVKGRYDAVRPRPTTARSDVSRSKSDLSSNQGRRVRHNRVLTPRTSMSGSSLGRSNLVVSATPPPVPGTINSGAPSPVFSQYQPSMLSQETSASSAAGPRPNRVAEVHRLSGKVASYEAKLLGAKAGFLDAASKAEEDEAQVQQADKLMEIFERVHKAHLERCQADRDSLMAFMNKETDKNSPSYKAAFDLWLGLHQANKPSDFRVLLLEAISIFQRRSVDE
ncbi:hypothetical protein RhiLY_06945 [Ceratobasidium sp. AG-Ba]|nr:hypothetical protein RhiLY_06945 [Ceratobasidium sp. AG-Ba]